MSQCELQLLLTIYLIHFCLEWGTNTLLVSQKQHNHYLFTFHSVAKPLDLTLLGFLKVNLLRAISERKTQWFRAYSLSVKFWLILMHFGIRQRSYHKDVWKALSIWAKIYVFFEAFVLVSLLLVFSHKIIRGLIISLFQNWNFIETLKSTHYIFQ